MFAATDIAAWLDAMGDDAVIAGALSFRVDFHGPFETIDLQGGEIVSSEPFALANPADISDLGITAGDAGTVLTVMGQEYRVTAIEPEEAGFSILHLGKA
ncbi:MAG: hypothetical protein VR65_06220 [Desulfobulbaceae bacterium BRH_c16a]|nr:MAG: hypothetical protein VR65_06220 [Desulfobulbaceae bacterium BRH_c16a]